MWSWPLMENFHVPLSLTCMVRGLHIRIPFFPCGLLMKCHRWSTCLGTSSVIVWALPCYLWVFLGPYCIVHCLSRTTLTLHIACLTAFVSYCIYPPYISLSCFLLAWYRTHILFIALFVARPRWHSTCSHVLLIMCLFLSPSPWLYMPMSLFIHYSLSRLGFL